MAVFASAAEMMKVIKSGHRIFVHGAAATPHVLINGLMENSSRLKNVELIHLHTEGLLPYVSPKYTDIFRVVNLFVGSNVRRHIDGDRIDYLPCFLSEVPNLFLSRKRPIHVAFLHLSPPDEQGYCTLGTSVDVAKAAFHTADLILAQINKQMPRTFGDGHIHLSDLDHYIEVDVPLPETKLHNLTSIEESIGRYVASLVEDGSCLQVGIGAVPDAVLAALSNHQHLGLHTETWSDGVLDLLKKGVIDNSQKSIHVGKSVSSFILGSQSVYEFIHDNPSILQLGADYVNNPNIIARNNKVVAINSATEIDLTGQICADSVGHRIISGVGGQMDFITGASLSYGGKPIIAITSRANNGKSRIVAALQEGGGVVTTRAQSHYVVTEYGIADLYGKTLGERASALIEIAHPDDRARLQEQFKAPIMHTA